MGGAAEKLEALVGGAKGGGCDAARMRVWDERCQASECRVVVMVVVVCVCVLVCVSLSRKSMPRLICTS